MTIPKIYGCGKKFGGHCQLLAAIGTVGAWSGALDMLHVPCTGRFHIEAEEANYRRRVHPK